LHSIDNLVDRAVATRHHHCNCVDLPRLEKVQNELASMVRSFRLKDTRKRCGFEKRKNVLVYELTAVARATCRVDQNDEWSHVVTVLGCMRTRGEIIDEEAPGLKCPSPLVTVSFRHFDGCIATW
jgi:hypothetical protein